jgi:ATP-binding cassette subfamily C (CFTR/MRP) protein 1
VDSYVGKAILENCLLTGPLSGTTRILVTHALHVLDKMDYIYVMDHGKMIEEGTYDVRDFNGTYHLLPADLFTPRPY